MTNYITEKVNTTNYTTEEYMKILNTNIIYIVFENEHEKVTFALTTDGYAMVKELKEYGIELLSARRTRLIIPIETIRNAYINCDHEVALYTDTMGVYHMDIEEFNELCALKEEVDKV